MDQDDLALIVTPADDPLVPVLLPLAATAAARLELARHLQRAELCLDDLEPDRRVWFRLRMAPGVQERRRELVLYLHPQEVLRDRPAPDALLGVRPVWQPAVTLPAEPPPHGVEEFHRAKAERFLLHQFLFVRDLCDGGLDPAAVPRQLAEAFQEAWSITVDGRLRRWHLPASSLAERRASFSRLFSRYGVLLPDHWRIFHQLWEREDLDQHRVAELVLRLPRSPR